MLQTFKLASQVALVVKNLPFNTGDVRDGEFDFWTGKMLWRRARQSTSVFLPGESHGQRSLVGPQGCTELDTTEVTQHSTPQTFKQHLLYVPGPVLRVLQRLIYLILKDSPMKHDITGLLLPSPVLSCTPMQQRLEFRLSLVLGHHHALSLQKPLEYVLLIFPIFQMQKLRHREVKSISPGSLVKTKAPAVIHEAQKLWLILQRFSVHFLKGKIKC